LHFNILRILSNMQSHLHTLPGDKSMRDVWNITFPYRRPEKHSSILNRNGEVLMRTEVSEDTKTLNVAA
jgi:hypothetical protein